MSAPPRVNGAHRPKPRRNRSWLTPALAAAAAVAVVCAASFALYVAVASAPPPAPVSTPAGAQPATAAVPAAPTTYMGQNVDEDGPAETTTKGCSP